MITVNGKQIQLSSEMSVADYLEQNNYPSITNPGMASQPITLDGDEYFVLGDNRNHSMDSRYWTNTFVEKDAIEAEVAIRYWPLNKIGTVN